MTSSSAAVQRQGFTERRKLYGGDRKALLFRSSPYRRRRRRPVGMPQQYPAPISMRVLTEGGIDKCSSDGGITGGTSLKLDYL